MKMNESEINLMESFELILSIMLQKYREKKEDDLGLEKIKLDLRDIHDKLRTLTSLIETKHRALSYQIRSLDQRLHHGNTDWRWGKPWSLFEPTYSAAGNNEGIDEVDKGRMQPQEDGEEKQICLQNDGIIGDSLSKTPKM